jgi:hypothetical protein
MVTFEMFGPLAGPEVILLLINLIVIFILIVFPILWFLERKKRKYWQAKAEDYEKRLSEKK